MDALLLKSCCNALLLDGFRAPVLFFSALLIRRGERQPEVEAFLRGRNLFRRGSLWKAEHLSLVLAGLTRQKTTTAAEQQHGAANSEPDHGAGAQRGRRNGR